MTNDKICKAVNPKIIETINLAVNMGRIDILEDWLKNCLQEIKFRGGENTYSLYAEKYYLERMLGK